MLINKRMNKENVMYIDTYTQCDIYIHMQCDIYIHTRYNRYNVIYLYTMKKACRKKEILPYATTWMNPEDVMLSKISQTKEDKFS